MRGWQQRQPRCGLGAAPLLDEPANSFAAAFAFELALLPAAAAARFASRFSRFGGSPLFLPPPPLAPAFVDVTAFDAVQEALASVLMYPG